MFQVPWTLRNPKEIWNRKGRRYDEYRRRNAVTHFVSEAGAGIASGAQEKRRTLEE